MRLITIIALSFLSASALADNDTTNSNNTNTSTQSNEITHNDTYDDHSQRSDASTHTDNSTDNSAYSHNTDSSYNQANKSWQTITNTNTEGDLSQSKNTNSFNSNTGNSNGSNVNQSATGGTSQSNASSASGAAAVGSNTVKTGSVGVSTGAVNIINNQVKQHRIVPFAFAPGLAMSFSQDNCANSASIGVSTGIFGASGGMPINNDACNRRKDVQMWLGVGQNRIACERMVQDEENMAAMRKAGLTCEQLTVVRPNVVTSSIINVPPNGYWDKMDKIADAQLNSIHKSEMQK